MKISGSNSLNAPVDQVWAAMLDPAVLARCIPGCETLTTTGPDQYAMRVTAGVAAIKGTYDGEVALTDKSEPTSLTMKARGAGAPGTIDATVAVRLAPSPSGGTDLHYDADAAVGGAVGGVGQRMLAGVTKKMAGQFFTALDRDIAGERPAATSAAAATTGTAGTAGSESPVYSGRTATANANASLSMDRTSTFALGALVGGALVALGVLIGSRIGRRP